MGVEELGLPAEPVGQRDIVAIERCDVRRPGGAPAPVARARDSELLLVEDDPDASIRASETA